MFGRANAESAVARFAVDDLLADRSVDPFKNKSMTFKENM
jgi:hypothetical protein